MVHDVNVHMVPAHRKQRAATARSAVPLLLGSYMERFWPQLEAWLAFMRASPTGLVSTPEEELRCTIECLRDTPVWYRNSLKDRWLRRNAAAAHRELSQDWVRVTNKSDKEVQLYKIGHLDFMVRRHMNQRQPAAPSAVPPAVGSSGAGGGGGGGGGFIDDVKKIKEALGITAAVPKEVLAEANEQMGLPTEGPLPQQAGKLMDALGLARG